jgi:hypothetical protein
MTNQASPAVLSSLRQPLSSRRASDLVLTGNPEVEPQLTVYRQLKSDYRQEISNTGFPLARPPMPHPI